VVGVALQGVSSLHRSAIRRQTRNHEDEVTRQADELRHKDEIRRGIWHDGRLDCVAGNGIMSELGIGDELFGERDGVGLMPFNDLGLNQEKQEETLRREPTTEDGEAAFSLPIVVIKNYSAKVGSSREELLDVLAQWAAMLAENQV
jgi:RNA12 protein